MRIETLNEADKMEGHSLHNRFVPTLKRVDETEIEMENKA